MSDGVRLATCVWRPTRAGRYPVVLNYSCYWQGGAGFEDVRRFLDAGYAYVGANVRGTGASEGAFSFCQPIEAKDGCALVAWAAAQSWSSGAVGMIGSSYGAHTQIKTAALRPAALRAITPMAIEASEYRDETWPGGLFNKGLVQHWAFVVRPDRARRGVEQRIARGDAEAAKIFARQSAANAYEEICAHRVYDAWWAARSLDEAASEIAVPTLLAHAWQDEYARPNGALRLFKLLHCQKRLLLQNGPHSVGADPFNQAAQIQWLDQFVKGNASQAHASNSVLVRWEVARRGQETEPRAGWITEHADWPMSRASLALHLTASGALALEGANDIEADPQMRSFAPRGQDDAHGENQTHAGKLPVSLDYVTAPMTHDTVVLGVPQLRFWFSAAGPSAQFEFALKDVDPSGNELFLQRSVHDARFRRPDASRSDDDEIIADFTAPQPIAAGEVYELCLSLSALGHVVRTGHKLKLTIAAPNSTPSPVWAFEQGRRSALMLHHGKTFPASLRLPVLADEAARAPAPPLGALPNQSLIATRSPAS